MKMSNRGFSPFFISVASVIAVTILIIITSATCAAKKIEFKTSFYFVCYSVQDNAVSASSISVAVSGFGGAGYILEYKNSYYVTVACYYSSNDAETVCASLKRRDLDCTVVEIKTGEYKLNRFSDNQDELYKGNLNTLHSLSVMAYECANSIDSGNMSQTQIKSVLSSLKNSLKTLKSANTENCFTQELLRLSAECDNASEGYVYSKDLRRLQIAITDTIINIELY